MTVSKVQYSETIARTGASVSRLLTGSGQINKANADQQAVDVLKDAARLVEQFSFFDYATAGELHSSLRRFANQVVDDANKPASCEGKVVDIDGRKYRLQEV